MAGVGFELRKAIQSDSKGERLKGYLGATFSSSGSMIVGIVIFCLIQITAKSMNISQELSDQFMCYVTTVMFLSMLVVSTFSLTLSRYVSNMIYIGRTEKILPSLIGGTVCVSVLGSVLLLVMLLISNLSVNISIGLMMLLLILNVCWLLMTYINLLRDYIYVVVAYVTAFLASVALLIVAKVLGYISIGFMLVILIVAFAIIDIVLFKSIYTQFSKQEGSIFDFLIDMKYNPQLVLSGLLMMVGTIGHFGVIWYFSDIGIKVDTSFRYSPNYDFPAIVAYFSTIPTAVYFITMFETNFGEKYQEYFYALGNGANTTEVMHLKETMFKSLYKGLKDIANIQLISCLLFITAVAQLLAVMNIGMTDVMLNSFRMFCVGYSLYYVGNTVMLMHLYFSNEKKSVWIALGFALGVLITSFIGAKYLKNSWGIGFTLVSALMTIVSTVQLLIYLNKLEFNVLCSEHTDLTIKNHPKRRSKSTSNRLTSLVVLASIVFCVVVGSGSWLVRDLTLQSKVLTFTPEVSNQVLKSPGMGLAPWAESEESMNIDSTLVYLELKWSDWEPQDDIFDIDYVNEYYNLDYYREDGRKVVFRFICDNPTDEEHMDIPSWLYDITGDGEFYDIDYGKGYSPNYNNQTFIEEHAEAVSALGKAFGQDDFFTYVELGSLGHWGEWHVDYESGLQRIPTFNTREQYIKPYIDAFPNATLLIRYPLIDATQYSMGLFNDMTGDYDETVYWLHQMETGVWEQTNELEQVDCSDVWKVLPIGGEFASTYENSYFMKDEFDLTLEGIQSSHQSFIGPKIIIDEEEEGKYDENMNTILKTLGYRYRISEVSLDFGDKETFGITCNVVNDGIAPIYQEYTIQLDISDEDGYIVWSSDETDLDLRSVLPDDTYSFTIYADKEEFDDDMQYTLEISIVDSSGNAVVPMALVNEIDTNVYQIAKFYIK